LAAIAVAAAIWLFGRGSSVSPGRSAQIDPSDRSGPVAVLGFENLADPADTEHLSRMLAGLITTGLGDSGRIELVSSAKVRTSLKEAGATAGGFDPTLAAKAARIAGARTMVVGQVMQNDEMLLLTAELVDVVSGNTLGTMRAEGAGKSALFAMAGEIATEVSGHLSVGQVDEGLAIDLAHSLTDSAEAYGLYAAGQLAVNERRFEEAIAQLEKAIRIDPTFALAYYELGMAQLWHGDRGGALRNLHNGLQYVDRLPPRWQTTYRAVIDYEAGNVDSGFAALESLVAQSPEMPDPYNYLGEFLTHYSKYADPFRAIDMFTKALEIDPTYKIVLFHLTSFLLLYEEVDEARALLERYRDDQDRSLIQLRFALLYHERRYAEIVELEEDPRFADRLANIAEFPLSLLRTGNAERALELSAQVVENSVGYTKGIALYFDAQLSYQDGRFRRALESLSAAPPYFDSPVIHSIAATAKLTHSWVLELQGDIAGAIDQARAAREIDYFHPKSRFEAVRLLFAADRNEEGEREIEGLETLARDNRSPHPACWLVLARAERLRALGEASEALALLSVESSPICRPITAATRESVLAQAAEDVGDLEKALRHYRTLVSPPWGASRFEDDQWAIPALYEVARLEQRRGDLDAARSNYREFLEHWGNVDMPVPIVEQAREQLAVLGGS
ncbi:MAG: tetratricopeptide repeat protein, partial [Thermoanaerobaculia bacterium]